MPTQPLDQLSTALDATGRLIAAVSADQWAKPTPCEKWTVADVVNHLVAGNHLFASILGGTPGEVPPARVPTAEDLPGAYQASASAVLDAFGKPGALDRIVTVPFGTVPGIVALHLRVVEALVHGWDLARATGQRPEFPERLAEQELHFSRLKLDEIPTGRSPFAPPQPVAEGAPAIDRLAACLGRQVTLTTPGGAT